MQTSPHYITGQAHHTTGMLHATSPSSPPPKNSKKTPELL
ncbi:hypothetical protein THERMOS_1457 [Bathymodiolus thermophilus thioautotrophic gill symbiont]|uniref:Uncharacterized protein n=1 Tax=Bathymodiolus thermophilus thioautotrophic gill symbiont TaxID=2360 RepID=A0A8H8XDG1_9GAMM|nr:hypothetical protein THERMOS_1457 [Bathymodiolus thermophilus thioautotrophic gill symbiont]